MSMNDRSLSRVLVALEGAEPSTDTLAQLSRVLGSDALEIVGLFVEDEDLFKAARLPGFKEISFHGDVLDSNHERLQRDVAGELRRLKVNFEAAVRTFEYRCRIEVARGRWVDTLSEAAGQSALVLVCRTERASGLRQRSAPEFEPLLMPGRNVLIVNEPWASGRSVVVLGTDAHALRVGYRLAHPDGLDLVVAVHTGTGIPHDLPDGAIVVRVDDWSEASVMRVCRQWDARLLVARDDTSTHPILIGLLDHLPCSLLRLG
jgi:hypothetical protein